ncbi:unnamed protein product [Aphanomyces euteiches]
MEAVSVPLKLPNAPLRPTNLLLKTLVWPTSCPSRSSSKSFDRREVVAFLGQVALETGNLQYVEQIEKGLHCQASAQGFCRNIHNVVDQPGRFAKAANIINGALECGAPVESRLGEGVSPGNNTARQTAAFGKKSPIESTAESNEKQETSMETTESPSAIEETNRRGNGMTTESVAANTTDPKLANEDAEEPTTDSVQVDGFELFQTRAAKTVSWNWFASSTTDCDASLSANNRQRIVVKPPCSSPTAVP